MVNFPTRCGAVRRRRAVMRGSRRRWANGRGFWTHEGVDATHAMCARRSGCATGSEAPPNAGATGGNLLRGTDNTRAQRAAERWKGQNGRVVDWWKSFVTGQRGNLWDLLDYWISDAYWSLRGSPKLLSQRVSSHVFRLARLRLAPFINLVKNTRATNHHKCVTLDAPRSVNQ